jgi:hypothetical protein
MKYRIVEQLQTLVDEQKKAFDNYVLWSLWWDTSVHIQSWSWVW